MSLNGNLEVFPLEEVLRLLARSRKSGCLRVESGGVQGRIFLNGGTLTMATVSGDDELRRRFLSAGLVQEADIRKVELSGVPITDVLAPDVTIAAVSEFVREESVEGLYRIRRTGRGTFDFLMDLSPRYPTGQSFDAEVIVSEADRRALEWEDVESVLPSMDSMLRMVPQLDGDEAVTLSPGTWRILAALGGGASISEIARVLGWSDFRGAREMASLYRNGLVHRVEERPSSPAPASAPEPAPVAAEEEPTATLVGEMAPAEAPVVPADAEPAETDWVVPDHAVPVVAFDGPVGVAEEPVEDGFEEVRPEAPSDVEIPAGARAETPIMAPFDGGDASPEWGRANEVPAALHEDAAPPVDLIEEAAPVVEDAASWWTDSPVAAEVAVEDDFVEAQEPATPWNNSPWTAEIPTNEPVVQSTPWGSQVPPPEFAEVESVPAPVAEPLETQAQGAAEPEADRTGGWWAQTMGAAEAEPAKPGSDSEADRFLESVFSSLSEEGDVKPAKGEGDEDEGGFGMGLLRRRRMGAAARDISDNNR